MPQRNLIVYYSRTGTTRKLATTLASELGAQTAEIRCDRYRPGMFRYLLAGYDSVKGNLPPIDLPQEIPADYELVLIGTPVWTSYPALPIRAFLNCAPKLPARIGLFLTYGGHSPAARAIEELTALLPAAPEATLSLKSHQIDDGSYGEAARSFARKLISPDTLYQKPGARCL